MLERAGLCLVVFALVFLHLSCAKLDTFTSPEEGGVAIEKLSDMKTIPLKWGNLVQVSRVPEYKNRVQLWLQDEDKNLRVVTFDLYSNRLLPNARLISKK